MTCYERIRQGLPEKLRKIKGYEEWERRTNNAIVKELALKEKAVMALPEPHRTVLLVKLKKFEQDFFADLKEGKRKNGL